MQSTGKEGERDTQLKYGKTLHREFGNSPNYYTRIVQFQHADYYLDVFIYMCSQSLLHFHMLIQQN